MRTARPVFIGRKGSAALAAGLLLVAGVAGARAQETADAMLPVWRDANSACLAGPEGAAETRAACARRDHFTNRLSRIGFCYGRRGQPQAEQDWHMCGADSNRLGR